MRRKMKTLKFIVLVVLLIPSPIAVWTQVRSRPDNRLADRVRNFESFFRAEIAADKTVGMTVGFIKDDYTWVKAYGYSDLENKIAAKPESAYRIASVTKPMVAIAVMKLVEQGKIKLDDEIQKYVPLFPKKKYPITVRELLGHLSGLRHYSDAELLKEHKTVSESVKLFAESDLIAEP